MGNRNNSVSRINPEVTLKTPVIIFITLAYSPLRIFIVFRIYPSPVFFIINYIKYLYIIYGTTIT